MNRRRVLALIALLGTSIAASSPGLAQPAPKRYRIGFLGLASAADYAQNVDAFLEALRALGYEAGRNILIEYRWAEGRYERLPELAAELVRMDPDLLVAHGTGIATLQRATSTIPIVMGVSSDPVGDGLIKSLARPGGNTTGVTTPLHDLAPKCLEVLKEAVPSLRILAVLANFAIPATPKSLERMEAVAPKLGVRLRSFAITADAGALESTFGAILRERPGGLAILPDPLASRFGGRIAAFALSNRLPSISSGHPFVVNGGLVSYGGNFAEGWRLAARYVDRILRGAKPGDLAVEQPTRFELAINLKTAKALGVTIPQTLLVRADEVIQ
jgi:putative ABC transport system substrate-binding protein